MNPLTQSKNTTILPVRIALTLVCFALSPQARAVCQDACLTNNNTVQGDDALISLTTGFDNTAVGFDALFSNTGGSANTAVGSGALAANTGSGNTATGTDAMSRNTSGTGNVANGDNALFSNLNGNDNVASGSFALFFNSSGVENTANGFFALENNTTGRENTAVGSLALLNNTTGSSNIAIGQSAGINLTTGKNNIDIGNGGSAGETGRIRIGNTAHKRTFIAGISGVTVAGGVGVIIDTNGQLGTITSSKRFKEAIQPMDKASEAILALRPVTFRYKHELDPAGIPQFGLVAEQVEKVNPDLVARDEEGKPYSVRYEAVNAMLLNEFLKEHRTVQQQQATITQLKSALAKQETVDAEQQKQIAALTAGLQKVSAQLELNKPATQTVLNSR
jgi:hypothetical protein